LAAILELRELTAGYQGKAVLGPLSLTMESGTLGLLGPNGAGKSTLLKVLLGILRPISGSGTVAGFPLGSGHRLRRVIGYMSEADALIPGMTGIDYVSFAGELAGLSRRDSSRRAHELLHVLELDEARYRLLDEYSTGMKQRIKLAQSLIHDPPLLFLDEPTSGLDPSGRDAMLDLLQTLHKDHGKSFLLCTHLLGDVERTCKDMILLSGGQVLLRERVSSLSRTIPSEFRVRLLHIPPNSVLPEHWKPEGDGFVVHLGSKRGTSDGSVSDQNRVTEDTRLIWREASQMGAIVSHISPRHEDLRERFAQILAEAGGGKELREKKQSSSQGPTQKTGGPNE